MAILRTKFGENALGGGVSVLAAVRSDGQRIAVAGEGGEFDLRRILKQRLNENSGDIEFNPETRQEDLDVNAFKGAPGWVEELS
jgi:hypothetical protein